MTEQPYSVGGLIATGTPTQPLKLHPDECVRSFRGEVLVCVRPAHQNRQCPDLNIGATLDLLEQINAAQLQHHQGSSLDHGDHTEPAH